MLSVVCLERGGVASLFTYPACRVGGDRLLRKKPSTFLDAPLKFLGTGVLFSLLSTCQDRLLMFGERIITPTCFYL